MIVVDVETTGLDPRRHSIVSIGAVEFENPGNQFYKECRAWSGSEISDEAVKVNGFTREQVTDINKPSPGLTTCEFLDWSKTCKEITLAGHNIRFDYSFLKESFEKYSKDSWPFGYRTVDVHSICYAHYIANGITIPVKDKKSNISLDAALVYVGMPPEPMPHNALTGAKAGAEVLSRLVYGKVLFPEYSQYAIPGFI